MIIKPTSLMTLDRQRTRRSIRIRHLCKRPVAHSVGILHVGVRLEGTGFVRGRPGRVMDEAEAADLDGCDACAEDVGAKIALVGEDEGGCVAHCRDWWDG